MKVLIAGAAGFLGSNLVRYFLYHSKGINLVGVDNIPDVEKAKLRLYHNRKHKFYVADINSNEFKKIIELEKPDLIIDTIVSQFENDGRNLQTKIRLSEFNIPVLTLVSQSSLIKKSLQVALSGSKAIFIEIPMCFGFRENVTKGVGKIIQDSFNGELDGSLGVYNWIFVEELARIILEKINKGDYEFEPPFPSYEFSHMEITNFFYEYITKKEIKLRVDKFIAGEKIGFKEAIEKTADWYAINKWSKGIK